MNKYFFSAILGLFIVANCFSQEVIKLKKSNIFISNDQIGDHIHIRDDGAVLKIIQKLVKQGRVWEDNSGKIHTDNKIIVGENAYCEMFPSINVTSCVVDINY